MIGPSEVGHPCARWVAYRLAGQDKAAGLPPWRQTVGTAVDDLISGWLADDPDWLVHCRTTMGELAPGLPITGTLDAYHIPTRTVVDLKCPGPTAMKKFRRGPESPQYRVQVHGYAQGMIDAGYPVDTVAVVRLPTAGEFSDAIVKREAFDPAVAATALFRVQTIYQLVQTIGTQAAAHLPATEFYCTRCPFYKPNSKDLSVGCPGAVEHVEDPTMGGILAPK